MIDPPPTQPRRLSVSDGTGVLAQLPDEPAWQRRAMTEGWWPLAAVLMSHVQGEIETARNVLEALSVTLPTDRFTDAAHAVDDMFGERLGLCACHGSDFVDVQPAAQQALW